MANFSSITLNKNKNNLVLCELHYTRIHGKTKDSYEFIEGHYLVTCKAHPYSGKIIDGDDDYENIHIIEIMQTYKNNYQRIVRERLVDIHPHPFIRNFKNIVTSKKYLVPQIAQCIILPTQEEICIIKTVWINIIVRAWKKVFKERKRIIKLRSNPLSLDEYECNGIWPESCRHLPDLKGLLYGLNRFVK